MRYTKLIKALYRVTANKEILYVVDCRHDMDMLKRANGGVYVYEGNYYYLRTNFFQGVVDQIQDKIRFIKNKNIDFYFRCTDNKDEINLAKTKKIKPSLNFRDNYREKGLSVSQHPHYHGQYKYIYATFHAICIFKTCYLFDLFIEYDGWGGRNRKRSWHCHLYCLT